MFLNKCLYTYLEIKSTTTWSYLLGKFKFDESRWFLRPGKLEVSFTYHVYRIAKLRTFLILILNMFGWIHFMCIRLLFITFLSGITYAGQNWYEWARWGFWWFPSTSSINSLHFRLLLDTEGVFGSDSKMRRNTFKRLKALFSEFGIKI